MMIPTPPSAPPVGGVGPGCRIGATPNDVIEAPLHRRQLLLVPTDLLADLDQQDSTQLSEDSLQDSAHVRRFGPGRI
jgi:hypothetical protein